MAARLPDSISVTTRPTAGGVIPAGREPAGAHGRLLPPADRLADAELRAIVEELAEIARLELARSGRGRRPMVKRTSEVVASARRLGVDLDADRAVVDQLDIRRSLPTTRALAVRGASTTTTPTASSAGTVPRAGAVVNAGVRFLVDSVTANDETDPERLGRDEIAIGGIALAADGTTALISETLVGKFNDGDRVSFDPPLELANLSLRDATFPSTIGVIVACAEKDWGGFATFLRDAFDQVKGLINVVLGAVGGALGVILGAKIGALIGGEAGLKLGTAIGGPLGTMIGLLAGLVLGAIIGGIVALAGDDVFVPSTTTVSLDAPDASFEGGDTTDVAIPFVGFGGRYTVTAHWALVR
jgi:hypothetical protein